MLFMYWTGSEVAVPPAAAAWRKIYPDFRVFTDDDVVPLLPAAVAPLYRLIRLPSAKSDLARLLLLREHGGLYLDGHIGPTAPADLLATVERISEYNLILFGKGWAMTKPTDFDLMNGVVAARRGAPELDLAIELIVRNVAEQFGKEEATAAYVPYNLFFLTGTYIFLQAFFDLGGAKPMLRKEHEDSIFLHFMRDNLRSGFEIAAFYNYRKPGGHWSERQNQERFFLSR